MSRGRVDALLRYEDGRLRASLRILLYFILFAILTVAGQVAVSVLPRHPLQWGALIVTTIAAVVAGGILIQRVDGRPMGALGFPLNASAPVGAGFGFLVGGAFIAATMLLLLVTRSAGFVADAGTAGEYLGFLAWTLLFFAVAAAWEEAVFRGYPFQVLVERVGVWPATLLASGLFALAHAQNPNVNTLGIANIFLAGVMLSIAYLKTRSLWFATGVHLGWNWTMASLFDLPVSGLVFDTPLYTGVVSGPEWWTGGAFGPEAGLAATLALLVGTLWLLRSKRVVPDDEIRRLRPLVEERLSPGGI